MQNAIVAAQLTEYADLLEIQGANSFRVRAYRNAARTVENLSSGLETLIAEGADLTELEGIGKDLAEKIVTLVTIGELPALTELREQVPTGVHEMLRVPGLGPKKVATLFHDLNVRTLDDLRVAAESGKVAELKGFGKKTAQSILEGLALLDQQGKRYFISAARDVAEALEHDLSQVPGTHQVAVAGSCRRRRETCGDLDLLAVADDETALMDRLAAHPLTEKVLARGETKQRVRLRNGMELDLRVVPSGSFGAAMQYFTGSKEHNIVVRRMAQQRDLKINEYGVFRDDVQIAGATEEDVYAAIGLPWIPPELRENRGEFALAESGRLPRLIERADLQGDLHMHTTATDGTASIAEMANAAKERGLKYIAITDHSKRVTMANGLDADRLLAHWQEIERISRGLTGIHVLRGIECDILEDGSLDLEDHVLAEADWVIAVLHYGLKQPRDQIMKRLLNAIRNPHVDAIGHPTGRMINHRAGADIDFDTFLKAAADHGTWLEINANPARLDLDDVHAAAARDLEIPIVIDSDAHSVNGFDVLEYGVDQARRAGLRSEDVVNTLPWPDFWERLQRRQPTG
ncbi:MAG: DNA polymerase/3'-5' exonuclease PolX [Planctomycetaceae bacterium]|nr:DNA polymerase/3'-5' exonuclease PolX [Planctomycetaceae bacterium]